VTSYLITNVTALFCGGKNFENLKKKGERRRDAAALHIFLTNSRDKERY